MKTMNLLPNTYYSVTYREHRTPLPAKTHDDYIHFLYLYCKHLHPLVHTYAYCLLPDSMHLLIKPRNNDVLQRHLDRIGRSSIETESYIGHSFSDLLQRYLSSVLPNSIAEEEEISEWQYEVVADIQEAACQVTLIHQFPQSNVYIPVRTGWPYTSRHSLESLRHTFLDRDSVRSWFGRDEFYRKERRQLLTEAI